MYIKSEYPRTNDGEARLWTDYRQGEIDINDMITHYRGLVYHAIKRNLSTVLWHVSKDELVSWGLVGLFYAITRFEPERDLRFTSFALPRIRGEIVDALRQQDWMGRYMRGNVGRVTKVLEDYPRATDEQIQALTGISMQALHKAKYWMENGMLVLVSLNEEIPRASTQPDVFTRADLLSRAKNPNLATVRSREVQTQSFVVDLKGLETRLALQEAMKKLSEEEMWLVKQYYVNEVRLHEIADMLSVTESRISQMMHAVLKKLEYWIDSEAFVEASGQELIPMSVCTGRSLVRVPGELLASTS